LRALCHDKNKFLFFNTPQLQHLILNIIRQNQEFDFLLNQTAEAVVCISFNILKLIHWGGRVKT
jgi:hypothetical protein